MAKPKPVYTYHEPLPESNPDHATRLLLLWKANWSSRGYDPIVLNEWHARKHELFEFLDKKVRQLPTINLFAYEYACWMRWLAMATIGGGIMTDADVMIYGDVDEFTRAGQKTTLTSLQGHVPCCVFGSKAAYESVVKQMIEYTVTEKDIEEGQQVPHVSDMYMFYRGGIKFTSRDIVKNHGDEGWEQAPLVHYANSSMRSRQPRHEWIPKLRSF
jgi:hypothetical protein